MMEKGVSLSQKIMELEKAEILGALEETGWVKAKAARVLGITERMIGYRIKKYGLQKVVVKGHLTEVGKGLGNQ